MSDPTVQQLCERANADIAAFEVWFEEWRQLQWESSTNVERGYYCTPEYCTGFKRWMSIAWEAARVNLRLSEGQAALAAQEPKP